MPMTSLHGCGCWPQFSGAQQFQGCSRLLMPGQCHAGPTQFTAVQALPGHAAAGSLLCGPAVRLQQVSCDPPMLPLPGCLAVSITRNCCRHLSELLARLEDHAYGMTPDADILWGPPVKPARPSQPTRPSQVRLLPLSNPLMSISGCTRLRQSSSNASHTDKGATSSPARIHASWPVPCTLLPW